MKKKLDARFAQLAERLREVARSDDYPRDARVMVEEIANVIEQGIVRRMPREWQEAADRARPSIEPATLRVRGVPGIFVPIPPDGIHGGGRGRPTQHDTSTARWLLRLATDPLSVRFVGYGEWEGGDDADSLAYVFAFGAAHVLVHYGDVGPRGAGKRDERAAFARELTSKILEKTRDIRVPKQRVVHALVAAGWDVKRAHDDAAHAERAEARSAASPK